MSMNEADIRYHLIDPVSREKGYVSRDRVTLETVLTPPPVEPTGPKAKADTRTRPRSSPASRGRER